MYIVAKGYSLITFRGVMGSGKEVKKGDFFSGTFENLLAKGCIIPGKQNDQLEKETFEKQAAKDKAAREAPKAE
ncbi:MAG: hypothetical protein FWC64_07110 [Treponema sp.]|nr:hypothetical protein [Treponema sp.]